MIRKKILYIHHGGGQGGAPNSLLFLIKNLDRELYEPIVACGFNEPKAKEFFEGEGIIPINISVTRFSHFYHSSWSVFKMRGIRAIVMWMLRYFHSRNEFKKILKSISPDIVHLNSLSIAPLAYVAKRMKFPVVLHVREAAIKLNRLDIRWRWLNWLANNYADRVIYICYDNQAKLTGNKPHTTVIYNPVPFDKFDKSIDGEKIRKELNIPLIATVLFFPGGSSHGPKGILPFLNALAKLREVNKSVIAIIPNIEDNVEVGKVILELSLNSVIIKLPFTNSVEDYFAASDVVITPFIVPHFSRAIIEAGAMAKPVVGSKIGGIQEVVIDTITGFLVKPGDEDDLYVAINKLIDSKLLRRKMGDCGFDKATSLYSAKTHAKKVMEIYSELESH